MVCFILIINKYKCRKMKKMNQFISMKKKKNEDCVFFILFIALSVLSTIIRMMLVQDNNPITPI
jgi:hypothetical protein